MRLQSIGKIVIQVIQKRLKDSGIIRQNQDTCWSSGLSASRIQAALNKWKVDVSIA